MKNDIQKSQFSQIKGNKSAPDHTAAAMPSFAYHVVFRQMEICFCDCSKKLDRFIKMIIYFQNDFLADGKFVEHVQITNADQTSFTITNREKRKKRHLGCVHK